MGQYLVGEKDKRTKKMKSGWERRKERRNCKKE